MFNAFACKLIITSNQNNITLLKSNTNSLKQKHKKMPSMNQEIFEKAERKLSNLLFQIDTKPLYFENSKGEMTPLNGYNAIFRKEEDQLFTFQQNKEKIISNGEALSLGKQVFKKLYPQIRIEELRAFKVCYPDSKKFCQIRLVHEAINFEVFNQDNWYPYLEIINCFDNPNNTSCELGFVRWLCCNGVSFGKKMRFNLKNSLDLLNYNLNQRAKNLQEEFTKTLKRMKNHQITERQFDLEIMSAFSDIINAPPNSWTYRWLDSIVNQLKPKYLNEMGDNAYAALNIISDITSNQMLDGNKFLSSSQMKTVSLIPQKWIELASWKLSVNDDQELEDILDDEPVSSPQNEY